MENRGKDYKATEMFTKTLLSYPRINSSRGKGRERLFLEDLVSEERRQRINVNGEKNIVK